MSKSKRKAECRPLWHTHVLYCLVRKGLATAGGRSERCEGWLCSSSSPCPQSKPLLGKGPCPLTSSELPI